MRSGIWTATIGVVLVVGLALGVVAWQGMQQRLSMLEDQVAELSQQQGQTASPNRVNELSERTGQMASQLDDLSASVGELRDRMANVEAQAGGPSSDTSEANAPNDAFRFAYVDMFQVLQDLQDSPIVAEPLQEYREEQQRIEQQKEEVRQRFEAGEITASERDQRLSELDSQLQQLNLQLSAPIQQNMVEVIRQIGEDQGYDLVIDNPASQYDAIVLYSQSAQVDDITTAVVEQLKQRLREQQNEQGESSDGTSDEGEGAADGNDGSGSGDDESDADEQ